jgi:hypothetical protein
MQTKILITSLIAILLFSCIKTSVEPKEIIISKDEKKAQFSDIFNIDKIIKLDTTDSCLINIIFKVKLTEKNIFVLSSNQVYVFNADGEFISKIGKLGNGPNELLKPSDFCLSSDNEQIAIWDNMKRKLNIFNIDGTFGRSYNPGIRRVTNFQWVSEHVFLFDSEFEAQGNEYYSVYEYNSKTGKTNKLLPYHKEHEGYNLLSYDAFPKYNGEQCYISCLNNCLYNINNNSDTPILKFNFGSSSITSDLLTQYNGDTFKLVQEIQGHDKSLLMKFYHVAPFYIVNYSRGQKIFTNIITSDTNEESIINHSNPMDLFSPLLPYSVDDKKLICIADPYKLMSNFNQSKGLVKSTRIHDYNFMKKLCSELNNSDNPLIFITSIKTQTYDL